MNGPPAHRHVACRLSTSAAAAAVLRHNRNVIIAVIAAIITAIIFIAVEAVEAVAVVIAIMTIIARSLLLSSPRNFLTEISF